MLRDQVDNFKHSGEESAAQLREEVRLLPFRLLSTPVCAYCPSVSSTIFRNTGPEPVLWRTQNADDLTFFLPSSPPLCIDFLPHPYSTTLRTPTMLQNLDQRNCVNATVPPLREGLNKRFPAPGIPLQSLATRKGSHGQLHCCWCNRSIRPWGGGEGKELPFL